MKQSDLAHKQYWEGIYQSLAGSDGDGWTPRGYEERVIGVELDKELRHCRPKSALEAGCGNSPWLPYLATRYGLEVTGIDYAEKGCELARQRLDTASVKGSILCRDLFSLTPEETGVFDFVYSLGVVEHFSDPANAIKKLLEFVSPGGTLFTAIPNLKSIHGLLMWCYQPELLKKHRIITVNELDAIHRSLGLHDVRTRHAGIASVGIMSRGVCPRIRRLDKLVVAMAAGANSLFQLAMKRAPVTGGLAAFAPFIIATGAKPNPDGQ